MNKTKPEDPTAYLIWLGVLAILALVLLPVVIYVGSSLAASIRQQRQQEQQQAAVEAAYEQLSHDRRARIKELDAQIAEQKDKLEKLDQWIMDNTTRPPERDEYGREIPRSNP